MKPLLAMTALMGAALISGCESMQQNSLPALIEWNTLARGGAGAIESVRNLRIRVNIVEPTFSVSGDYRATDGRMHIDIYADGALVFSEGVDDAGAWQQSGAGAPITETSEAGRAALLHGIEFNLFGLHQLEERGHRLSLEDDETLDGIAYKVVKVTLSDGFETYLYINPANSMVERRRDVRALHPDADPTEKLIENRYFDFTAYCRVLHPASSRQIDVTTGEQSQTTKVTSQECNLSEDALKISRNATVG